MGFARNRLYARYKMVSNAEHWHVMQGADEAYTQVDETSVRNDGQRALPAYNAGDCVIEWQRRKGLKRRDHTIQRGPSSSRNTPTETTAVCIKQ